MNIWQYDKAALSRRHSQLPMLREHAQGETVQRPSKASLTQSLIMKRSNKKYSVANAAATIGLKTALLVGKLGIIIFKIYFVVIPVHNEVNYEERKSQAMKQYEKTLATKNMTITYCAL
jgi:hypothetical protein